MNEGECYLKCWGALVIVGREVLLTVLHWGFPNPQNVTIRDALMSIPGYSNTKYKHDFNKDERHKIENEHVNTFDITLLYTLIHRLCSLTLSHEKTPSTNIKTISQLLLKIKTMRNKFAHPIPGLTETEMVQYISQMKQMFLDTTEEAANEFYVHADVLSNVKNEVADELMKLTSSSSEMVTEQLKQIARKKTNIVFQEGIVDLRERYSSMMGVSITPWSFEPSRHEISSIFIKGRLCRYHPFSVLQNRLSKEESYFDIDDILCLTSFTNTVESNFILISSPSGSGKTTLLKYIVHSWLTNGTPLLKNIDQFDFTFFIDCRELNLFTLTDILGLFMPKPKIIFSDSELRDIVMSQKCLFLLDNIDEISEDSHTAINEIFLSSSHHKIIATSCQNLNNQLMSKVDHRNPIVLNLETLTNENRKRYFRMLSDCMQLTFNAHHENIDIFIKNTIGNGYLPSNWLCNPEILSHIFFRHYFTKETQSEHTSHANIFLQSLNLILTKMKDRIASKLVLAVTETCALNNKLTEFVQELGRIALVSLVKGNPRPKYNELIVKCQDLNLPVDVILPEFACLFRSRTHCIIQDSDNLVVTSSCFQNFCSAYYVFGKLVQNETSLKALLNIHKLEPSDIIKNKVKQLLKFLTGLLSSNKNGILDTSSEDIVQILKEFCVVTKCPEWLEYLEEAQWNTTFTSVVLQILDDKWEVENDALTALLVRQLYQSPPQDLKIFITQDPTSLGYFPKMLEACKAVRSPMNLSLNIYYQFWNNSGGLSDIYIESLKVPNDPHLCNLESFAGRLSMSTLQHIPKTVKKLALQIDFTEISNLNKVLPGLQQLQLLSLCLSISEDVQSAQVPPLTLVQRPIMLSLDVFGCKNDNTEKCGDAVSRISKNIHRLALRKTDLCYLSCRDFVDFLNASKCSVNVLVIGSTNSLKSHEEINLKSRCLNLLECKTLKWIHL